VSRRYVNAVEALPHELLQQLSEALGGQGTYLWVPATRDISRVARNAYVARLWDQGYSAADIAEQLFISERTVWRILKRERARRAPSDPPPQAQQPTCASVSGQSVRSSGGSDATE